jgi:hypothetical protein
MSRGLGWMQRYLFETICTHGKPVTFADLRAIILNADNAPPDHVLRQSVERSLRRALHSMVRDKTLIAIGGGGRGDPHRYFLDPVCVALFFNESEANRLLAWMTEANESD